MSLSSSVSDPDQISTTLELTIAGLSFCALLELREGKLGLCTKRAENARLREEDYHGCRAVDIQDHLALEGRGSQWETNCLVVLDSGSRDLSCPARIRDAGLKFKRWLMSGRRPESRLRVLAQFLLGSEGLQHGDGLAPRDSRDNEIVSINSWT